MDDLELLINSANMWVEPRASCELGKHYQLSYSPNRMIPSLSRLLRTEQEHGTVPHLLQAWDCTETQVWRSLDSGGGVGTTTLLRSPRFSPESLQGEGRGMGPSVEVMGLEADSRCWWASLCRLLWHCSWQRCWHEGSEGSGKQRREKRGRLGRERCWRPGFPQELAQPGPCLDELFLGRVL